MSDLEFQRELSPEEIREALSLLDSAARAKTRSLPLGDVSPTEEVDAGTDQAGATMAIHPRLAATGDPQHLRKHLNLAIAFYGLGIAAAAAVTLLSWSERALTPPVPEIARQQLPNQPVKPVNGASPSFLVTNSRPDQSSGGSERAPKRELAGPSPGGQTGDHQAAVGAAASSASAIPYAARPATVPAIATMQAWWDERTSRKRREGWWHGRAVRGADLPRMVDARAVPTQGRFSPLRVAAAKSRFWRRHWQPRAVVNNTECFSFACVILRNQRAFNYDPPRNLTQ
jgi:hypothetical protein